MAELVSLIAMKDHLKVLSNDDDATIAGLTIAARRSCEKQIGYTVVGDAPELVDPDDRNVVAQAVKLLVGAWYRNREAVSSGLGTAPTEMPLSVKWLLETLRKQVA